jgi:hypothetical protein
MQIIGPLRKEFRGRTSERCSRMELELRRWSEDYGCRRSSRSVASTAAKRLSSTSFIMAGSFTHRLVEVGQNSGQSIVADRVCLDVRFAAALIRFQSNGLHHTSAACKSFAARLREEWRELMADYH